MHTANRPHRISSYPKPHARIASPQSLPRRAFPASSLPAAQKSFASTFRSGYDGAGASRLIGNWFPANLDFNQLIATASPNLRNRVRDLVRNFPPFARAVNAIVAFTVGRGARFQSLATTPDGDPDFALRQKIEDRFRAWMDKADITGHLHFYELQQLAKRQECECGECIARFASPRRKGRHPVAVQMFEPENLAAWETHNRDAETEIFQGIEYDIYTGEPIAYHFQRTEGWHVQNTWREPAENVLHAYPMQRPGQMRGITPFAPAVMLARDMGDYTGAEIDSAKMAAKWLAMVKTGDPTGFQMARMPGQSNGSQRDDIEGLENAIIEYLRDGEDIVFAPGAQRPGDSFDRFTRFVLRMVSITMDLPYEILSGDYTNINYSTSKASRNDFAMFLVPHQFRLETHFVRPIYKRWLDYEALTQDYLKGYFLNPDRFLRAMWIPAGMPRIRFLAIHW